VSLWDFREPPALTFPLYQETPRAQQPRRKEIDRRPSSETFSLRPDEREKGRRRIKDVGTVRAKEGRGCDEAELRDIKRDGGEEDG
jgi:hypothetical protein